MKILNYILFLFLLFIFGCNSYKLEDVQPSSITSIKDTLIQQSENIDKTANTIDKNTEKPIIKKEVGKLLNISKVIVKQAPQLIKINKAYTDLQIENKKLKDDIKKFIDKNLAYVWITAITIAFFGIIAGIAIIVISKGALGALGIEILLISIGALGVAYSLAYYPLFAIISGIIILIGGGFLLVSTLLKANERREKELTEVVRTTELVKKKEWNDETKREINTIQSPETQEVIKNIKKKDKLK